MTVLAIANSARVPIGRLGEVLDEAGVQHRTIPVYEGVMPDRRDWQAVVVLGGHMGAYDGTDHPWLASEMSYVQWALGEQIPTLGICLGSQLIAHATGGRAFLGELPEVGLVALHLTDEGKADPVASQIGGPVLAVHRDTFELPPGAVLLAASDRYPHAYRYGSALGVQFHPEADLTILARWVEEGGLDEMADQTGVSVEQVVHSIAEHEELVAADAKRLFEAWLESDVL